MTEIKNYFNKAIKLCSMNVEKTRPEARLIIMAERTGLEPATPGVTGRYSNQLNYRSRPSFKFKFRVT